MRNDYKVYIHQNRHNRKRYVGVTCQDVERRWKHGQGYKGSTSFYDAIKHCGWDMFTHTIVKSGLSRKEAYKLEEELILKYRSNDRRYGYNMESGGEHPTKAASSCKIQGIKQRGVAKNPESIIKMSIAKNPKKIKIICVETNTIYDSLTNAGKSTGINKSNISIASLKNGTAGGFHWKRIQL